MKRWRAIVFLAGVAPVWAEEAKPTCLVEAQIFKIADAANLKIEKVPSTDIPHLGDVPVLGQALTGNFRISTRSAEVLMTGGKAKTSGKVDCLMAPKLLLPMNESGSIFTSQKISYMERLPSGDFRLVECKEPLKTGLGVTVKQGPEKETLRCNLDFKIQTLSGRKPVPGVDLNVGMPEISTRTLETEIVVRKNEPCISALFQDRDGLLIVMVAVREIDAGVRKSVGAEVPLDIKIQEAEPEDADSRK